MEFIEGPFREVVDPGEWSCRGNGAILLILGGFVLWKGEQDRE